MESSSLKLNAHKQATNMLAAAMLKACKILPNLSSFKQIKLDRNTGSKYLFHYTCKVPNTFEDLIIHCSTGYLVQFTLGFINMR